ncbi:MAG: hypothetical protein ACQEP1_05590 [Nanobdellota archaeon]
MYTELSSLMERLYGHEGINILKRILEKNNIKDLESASTEERRQIAKEISASIPNQSIRKSHMSYSEILKTLQVSSFEEKEDRFRNAEIIYDEEGHEVLYKEMNPDKKYFTSKEEFMNFKIEQQNEVIKEFWKSVSHTWPMIEATFNLFWEKADKAVEKGIPPKTIMKKSEKAVSTIYYKLKEAYEKAKKDLGMEEISTHFTRRLGEEEEKKVFRVIKRFWDRIRESYKRFRQLYLSSLETEINQHNEDLEKIKKETEKIEKEMKGAYEELEGEMNKIKQEYSGSITEP